MINLTLKDAEGFITKHRRKGIDVRWDGWTMVFHTPDPRGYVHRNGVYSRITNQWGFETRVNANTKGNFMVNPKLTKGNKVGHTR